MKLKQTVELKQQLVWGTTQGCDIWFSTSYYRLPSQFSFEMTLLMSFLKCFLGNRNYVKYVAFLGARIIYHTIISVLTTPVLQFIMLYFLFITSRVQLWEPKTALWCHKNLKVFTKSHVSCVQCHVSCVEYAFQSSIRKDVIYTSHSSYN